MLLNILIGILAAVGGVVIMAVIAVLLSYYLISKRLSRSLRQAVAEMERLLADAGQTMPGEEDAERAAAEGAGLVPPMHIWLETTDAAVVWEQDPVARRVEVWLGEHSFAALGDFLIPELQGELMRIYLSEDQRLVAALRRPADSGEAYVEFCFDLGAGARGGVSNPPGSPVAPASNAVGAYFPGRLSDDFSLLSRMWLAAKEMLDQHQVQQVDPERIAEFFEEAHAAEMESRIACGGVSEDEIRASFSAQGVDVMPEDIEEIQEQWQVATAAHLLDYSQRGLSHLEAGRDILIVHDGSPHSYLVNRLREMFAPGGRAEATGMDPAQISNLLNELKHLLDLFSPREAVARFRPLLPHALRYDLVDQLKQPVEADLYALPQPSK